MAPRKALNLNDPDLVHTGTATKDVAGHLSAENIGKVIRLETTIGGARVDAVVTGELRQIYHTGGETTLNLGNGTKPNGDLWEVTLTGDHPVVIL